VKEQEKIVKVAQTGKQWGEMSIKIQDKTKTEQEGKEDNDRNAWQEIRFIDKTETRRRKRKRKR
jgi:hypothetical protein